MNNVPSSSRINKNTSSSSSMKMKIVLRLGFKNQKEFNKAMKTISTFHGKMDSFSMSMHDKILTMVVTGVDPTDVATKLKKEACHVTPITYDAADESDQMCVIS